MLARAGALFGCAVWLAQAAWAQPIVRSQAPCGTPKDPYCVSFDHDDPIPLIRSFSFRVPRAGTAQVTFHGWLYCIGPSKASTLVALQSQILTQSGAVPRETQPGGLRLVVAFEGVGQSASSVETFNLHSTRTIRYPSGGTKTVYFKIARDGMSQGTGCSVSNAAFSVLFFP